MRLHLSMKFCTCLSLLYYRCHGCTPLLLYGKHEESHDVKLIMPKPPEVSHEFLQQNLKKCPGIFDANGKLKGERDPIWEQIRKDIPLTMLPKSIFLYVYKKCEPQLRSHFNLPPKAATKRKLCDEDYKPIEERITNPWGCDSLELDIELPTDSLIDILEHRKKPDWTDEVTDAIIDKDPIPCVFSYKNSYLAANTLKFNGTCSECKTGISGVSEPYDENSIRIRIKTFATHAILHLQKRKLARLKRQKKKQILMYKIAADLREEELGQMTTEYELPNLNNTITYRKARQEAHDERIGYSQFKGLSMSNKNFLSVCNIRKLSLSPFYAVYWTDDQLRLWNKIQSQGLPLSIDATGGLAKKFFFYKGLKSKYNYVYVLVVGIHKKIVPLLQIVSSIHHVAIIQEMLDRWIDKGAKIPKRISTDGSLTLQNAITITFNGMTFSTYNLYCYDFLLGNVDELPLSFYRGDVAHHINVVRYWKCVKLLPSSVASFLIHIIGFLITTETLQAFQDVVSAVVVVTSSKAAEDNSACAERKVALSKLLKQFKYDPKDFVFKVTEPATEKDEPKCAPKSKKASNKLLEFIDGIFEKAVALSDKKDKISIKANYYYCSEFNINFKNLCYTFPSWTAVMRPHFEDPNEVGTSARSEAYFKRKKENVRHAISVPKFILDDKIKIDLLTNFGLAKEGKKNTNDGPSRKIVIFDLKELQRMRLLNQKYPDTTNDTVSVNESGSHQEENTSLIDKDRYVGLEKEHTISDADHEILLDNEDSKPKNATVMSSESVNEVDFDFQTVHASSPIHQPHQNSRIECRNLILNGLNFDIQMFSIGDNWRLLKFLNTCPFDSIFEILSTLYMECQSFAQDVQNHKSVNETNFLKAIINYYETYFNSELMYQIRANILHPMYTSDVTQFSMEVECADNVIRAFEKCLTSFPCVLQKNTCSKCPYKSDRSLYSVTSSPDDFFNVGITKLESIIQAYVKDDTSAFCLGCQANVGIRKFEISSYLAVDLEYLHERRNASMFQNRTVKPLTFTTNFNEIPVLMEIKDRTFELKGVICFEGDPSQEPRNYKKSTKLIMHYKAYTFGSNGRWTLYNDRDRDEAIRPISTPITEKIALIIYAVK